MPVAAFAPQTWRHEGLAQSQAGSQTGGSGAGLPGFNGLQAQPAQRGKHAEGPSSKPAASSPQGPIGNWTLTPQALMAVQMWEQQLRGGAAMGVGHGLGLGR